MDKQYNVSFCKIKKKNNSNGEILWYGRNKKKKDQAE